MQDILMESKYFNYNSDLLCIESLWNFVFGLQTTGGATCYYDF